MSHRILQHLDVFWVNSRNRHNLPQALDIDHRECRPDSQLRLHASKARRNILVSGRRTHRRTRDTGVVVPIFGTHTETVSPEMKSELNLLDLLARNHAMVKLRPTLCCDHTCLVQEERGRVCFDGD